MRRWLAPILAMPHAALALGVAFLIAPSGWLMRLMAPVVAAGGTPPSFSLPADRWGLALMAGLVLKETPFLLLAIVAGLGQLPSTAMLATARLLGYRPATAWLKTTSASSLISIWLRRLWPVTPFPATNCLSWAFVTTSALAAWSTSTL